MTDFNNLRSSEFGRLDSAGHVYLDYTGSGLYPNSALRHHDKLLQTQVLGNPHSSNPTSRRSTSLVDATRANVLRFFNADPKKYCVIFTPNATGAIKLVGESFPFQTASTFLLLTDNHNSVNGIRCYAKQAGATATYVPLDSELRASHVDSYLKRHAKRAPNLFAFPAQSNFSGIKHDFSYVRTAQHHGWYVLLDAAAFVPTSRLDLSTVRPDFVAVSFYKMFGLPTGVGALIAKRKSLAALKRPSFAGGTVKFASVQNQTYALADNEAAFEDGTVNFLAIPAVSYGLEFMNKVGIDNISAHVNGLTARMLSGMLKLKYANGASMLKVYGPHTMHKRGGCISFDVLMKNGARVDSREVEEAANKNRISLRTGCFCNPGAAEKAIERDVARAKMCIKSMERGSLSMQAVSDCMGEFLGAVRASLGIASSARDVDKFLSFLQNFCAGLTGEEEECVGHCTIPDIGSEIVRLVVEDSKRAHNKHRHSSHHRHS